MWPCKHVTIFIKASMTFKMKQPTHRSTEHLSHSNKMFTVQCCTQHTYRHDSVLAQRVKMMHRDIKNRPVLSMPWPRPLQLWRSTSNPEPSIHSKWSSPEHCNISDKTNSYHWKLSLILINMSKAVQFITLLREFGRCQHWYTLLGRSIIVHVDAVQLLTTVVWGTVHSYVAIDWARFNVPPNTL